MGRTLVCTQGWKSPARATHERCITDMMNKLGNESTIEEVVVNRDMYTVAVRMRSKPVREIPPYTFV
jgi:hypothetical protein